MASDLKRNQEETQATLINQLVCKLFGSDVKKHTIQNAYKYTQLTLDPQTQPFLFPGKNQVLYCPLCAAVCLLCCLFECVEFGHPHVFLCLYALVLYPIRTCLACMYHLGTGTCPWYRRKVDDSQSKQLGATAAV